LIAVAKVAAWWFFPLFPIFFLNFPERSPLLERFPRLEAWIYWSMYVLLLPYWQPGRMPTRLRVWYANLPGLHWWLDLGSKYSIPVLLIVAYLTAGFFFMVLSYRIASAESRKRMRVAILGSVKNYAYRERAVTLAPGDVVAWLSDGFTECFNEAGEMLGDEAASMTLAQSAHLAPSEIVNHFVRVSDEWAGARPQDDDVTLVVVKARACSGREAA
jgi:hypothetical protein